MAGAGLGGLGRRTGARPKRGDGRGALFLPLVLHLLLSYPKGELAGRPARALLAGAYCSAALGVGRALVRDPLPRPLLLEQLLRQCLPSAIRPGSNSRARRLPLDHNDHPRRGRGDCRRTQAGVRNSGSHQLAMWLVIVPAAAAALAGSAYAVLLLKRPAEDPTLLAFRFNFVVRAATTIALGAGVLWGVRSDVSHPSRHHATARSARISVRRVRSPMPCWFAGGDDDVTVGDWLPSRRTFVDVIRPDRRLDTWARA